MNKKIGLALSGGGYRAAAFHLGTLRALYKLNALEKIDVLSTISGGSITGAAWALSRKSYPEFEKEMIEGLNTKSVIRFVVFSRTFLVFISIILIFLAAGLYLVLCTRYPWASFLVIAALIFLIIRFQFKLFPVSREIEKAYDKFFFAKKKLKDLPVRPDLAIGSTNLLSTTPFTFSHRKMGDAYFDYLPEPIKFKHHEFPVSRAVVASSCVPFAFTPVTIGREFYDSPEVFSKTDTKLVDGGVFDNQGIHKLTHENSSWFCPVVVVSDAGNKLPFEQHFPNTIALLIRTVDVFMDRIKAFQMMQNIYKRDSDSNKEIAFISLGWDLDSCIAGFVDNLIKNQIPQEVIDYHKFKAEWLKEPKQFVETIIQHLIKRVGHPVNSREQQKANADDIKIARSVGTNLTKLSLIQINALANHAEKFTELQVKLYCPSLFN
jgi:NTE family protein